jgi:hypothetical protein
MVSEAQCPEWLREFLRKPALTCFAGTAAPDTRLQPQLTARSGAMETITMKIRFGLAAMLVIAGFFAFAPATASAQNVSVGVGVYGRSGHIEVHVGDRHHRRHGHWDRRGPVYRDPGCRRGCDDGYYGRAPVREVITVYVNRLVEQRVWDPYSRCYVWTERWVQVPAHAYWDYQYGGYFHTDEYGNYVRVR